MLTREAILAINDIKTEEVYIPQWGDSILVRGLTGEERDDYENSLWQLKGKDAKMNMKNAKAKLVQKCVVDENGKHLFELADIETLGKKNAGALNKIYEVAQRLSGLTNEDMEELTKN